MAAYESRWAIVVPVKRLALAKTRIDLAPDVRMAVALAMAVDTITAAGGCPLTKIVIAVCDDPAAVDRLEAAGAHVVPDVPDSGLNPALVHGSAVDVVSPDAPVAALAADLPALRGDELAAVLQVAGAGRSAIVADASGSGTTLFTAVDRSAFQPTFGPDSRSRHIAAGAADLTDVADPGLRRDVDTLADLAAAARLGLGPATDAVIRAHALLD